MSCRSCQGWLIPHICGVAFHPAIPPRWGRQSEKAQRLRAFPCRSLHSRPRARSNPLSTENRGVLRAWGLGLSASTDRQARWSWSSLCTPDRARGRPARRVEGIGLLDWC